ncbi:AraC family transcriptional regulator [Lentilactobacillus sp. Marseille-Q4993]|uniref:helix-turn-helix transcriptional regulator n=1 Tax=Lentilactobacillus sp. Marseille-Q4993 TaxID=3039492 RepID=UPI0024BCF75B|nr:AraC family transcriptional regulator [Lentilactobacillus sp. Marseille-Q4993]
MSDLNKTLQMISSVTKLNAYVIGLDDRIKISVIFNSHVNMNSLLRGRLDNLIRGTKVINVVSIDNIVFLCHFKNNEWVVLGPFAKEHNSEKNYYLFSQLSIFEENEIDYLSRLFGNLLEQDNMDVVQKKIYSYGSLNGMNMGVDNIRSAKSINHRYETESELMHSISMGDINSVSHFEDWAKDLIDVFEKRIIQSPLRSGKNICFVINTLCRISAREGNVQPVVLDRVSEKYATKIESQLEIKGLKNIVGEMIREYTSIVRDCKGKKYTPTIRRCVDFIDLNFNKKITLEMLSTTLNINANYLSRQFNTEVGLSITEYVNELRVDLAKFLISTYNLKITDIALHVGFEDSNYFTKVFKNIVGKLPSEYKREI